MKTTNIRTEIILEATAELKEQIEKELSVADPACDNLEELSQLADKNESTG